MKILRVFLYLCSAPALAALVGGYLGAWHPALDSLSHFRLHLAAVIVAVGLMLALTRLYWGGAALALSGAATLWLTLGGSGFSPALALPDKSDLPVFRLMQINLRFDNQTPNEVIRLIGAFEPDVIAAEEVSDMWKDKLAAIQHMYPHQVLCTDHNGLGDVAVLSRRPFAAHDANFCAGNGGFAVQAVNFGGREVLLGVMHLHWPWPFQQAQEISGLAPAFNAMAQSGLPLVLAGDTNSAPWSHSVQRIAALSGSAHLPYQGASWLANALPASWKGWAGLPIDNVFGRGMAVHSIATGPYAGSDHLPVLLEFSILDAPEKPVQTVFAD